MKKHSILMLALPILGLFWGCEGSFEPNELLADPFEIDLVAPPNNQQCLTEGDDGNGNWNVQFNWAVIGEFSGDFTLVLTEVSNGNQESSQVVNPGDQLSLPSNTWFNWQVRANGEEDVESEIFTFVTPAPPSAPTSPPAISVITVVPEGAQHRITFTVIDDDLSQVQLSLNGSVEQTFAQTGVLEALVTLQSGQVEIKVTATDNSGNSTEQTLNYNN